ncbi:hypothetical protein VCSRO85_2842 [Vibrio cholerae]|nr:hypothetical protein VCSRO85_2842 [Vibrio cholerae]
MAAFGGYPQNVTFSTVNVAKGGGSENLLINPRGKINQLNEPDGVLSAGVYFCDGWKAGAGGAEVYRDHDGFRLISGSIVQLVPNNLGAGRNLRANMDIISGSPVMSINGGSDNAVSSDSEYISLEISGDNSKFTRIILAESLEIPIYQQSSDELMPCLKFLQTIKVRELSQSGYVSDVSKVEFLEVQMHKVPAITDYVAAGIKTATDNGGDEVSSTWRFKAVAWAGWSSAISFSRVLDARP